MWRLEPQCLQIPTVPICHPSQPVRAGIPAERSGNVSIFPPPPTHLSEIADSEISVFVDIRVSHQLLHNGKKIESPLETIALMTACQIISHN